MEKSELNSTVILYEILVCYNCNASDLVSISISIVPTTLRCIQLFRCQSHRFQVLTLCRSRSQALIIEERDLGSIITWPFCLCEKLTSAQYTWTDDEVELLLKV